MSHLSELMERSKIRKVLNLVLKIAILLASYFYIYYQIRQKGFQKLQVEELSWFFEQPSALWVMGLLFLMMLLNWGLEAKKWQFLIRKKEKISFLTSLKAVMAGVTVSAFTPNRVGEYIGRVFLLKSTNPWQGAFMTMVGSISQLMVTILLGSVALVAFSVSYLPYEDYIPTFLFWCIVGVVTLLNAFLLLFYFNVRLLEPLLRRFTLKRWVRLREHLKIFSEYTFRELLVVFLFSFFRYLVFSLQFVLLLRFFMVPVSVWEGLMVVSCLYLFLTAVPTIALSELGVRGSLAVFFFGILYADQYLVVESAETGSILASLFIWILNLVIPALVGGFFVLQLKFFRK